MFLRNRLISPLIFLAVVTIIWFYTSQRVPEPTLIEIEVNSSGTFYIEPLKVPQNGTLNLFINHITTSKPCKNGTVTVIIITSHVHNVETRSAIRRAFPGKALQGMGVKRVFLLGTVPNSPFVKQPAIFHENERFGDLIQGDFIEAYRNLTYKHLMGLKWASENCQSAQTIIKMDDDIVLDLRKIHHLLETRKIPTDVISGYVFKGMIPIREPANKWYVTRDEYSYSKYPSFVSGWFYITTPLIARKLVVLSRYYKYFWIDDVYITGILALNSKTRFYDLKKYFTTYPEFLQCCIKGVEKGVNCDILVGPNGGDNNLFFTFNKAMETCFKSRCSNRTRPLKETCVTERKIILKPGGAIIEKYQLH